jgi:transposase-like protein
MSPKVSIYQKKLIDEKKRKAFDLYKEGYTMREIGRIVERSYTWVMTSMREMEKLDKIVESDKIEEKVGK